ncbi:RNA polymerase sigma factor [Phytomonospora endophytica]|uniref:RNA polymerase sigma-70 factor (ECF subfamily) n=1 Tax=Phytomonospora endophytica TaxID=714109 RepID=A0A841FML4_9ACTN|nr:RNA polymerase sigma factor [Phytomonospora endophytica]MBB6038541.1 RNA polymerase sigma-70 factor (ECF subfamily) [Phytomonospora endophytica]GIG69319.1 DNA-directed RNA polymerase sigma-70 factor [Phytomonospora endophytica]
MTTPPAPDLATLVARAKTGDAAAFAELYTLHRPTIRRVVYARMRHGARRDADDLIAETFTRAWANMPRFTWQGGGFAAWLTRIATNLVRDWHKAPHTRITEPCGDYTDVDSPDLTADPAERVCLAGDVEQLRAALGELTAMQQRCVDLRVYRERTIKETAEVLGMTEGAVKALFHRAVLGLRRVWEPDG